MREVVAAERRVARDQERRARLRARQEQQLAKLNAIERATEEAKHSAADLEALMEIHRDCSEPMHWMALAAEQEPQPPRHESRFVEQAELERSKYEPSLLTRLFRQEAKHRAALDLAVEKAQADARIIAEAAEATFMQKHAAWTERGRAAEAILAGDLDAYRDAVTEVDPLECMSDFGITATIHFPDRFRSELKLRLPDISVVPAVAKNMTATGKLSVKPLSDAKREEIYLHFLCGCALRAARELAAFLPINMALVTIFVPLLDRATGRIESKPVLSVAIPRQTLGTMNFASVDSIEALRLFLHASDFKKAGPAEIAPLDWSHIQFAATDSVT